MNLIFDDIKLNAGFQMNIYDKTIWIKCSSRTARLLENPHKAFYFSKNEMLYALNNNDFYIKGV